MTMKTICPSMMKMRMRSNHPYTQGMNRFLSARLSRAAVVLALLSPALALTAPMAIHAETKQESRTVRGRVSNKDGSAVKGAVVHLKDLRGLSQKSYITPDNGEYRFGALNSSTDYEIWAEFEGKKSSVKHISSFDAKNTFDITLTIN